MNRVFDVTVSLAILIALAPVLLVVATAVRLSLGSPVFFTQIRPGLHGKPFRMFKFRTMRDASDVVGSILPDEERLTTFGGFLRASSMDELPELWNVFKGDMSLIGPRPLLMEYLPRYNEFQMRRHEVRPGITGWAQVNGRNAISWDKKFELDVWYVDNQSMWLDLKILLMTLKKVFCQDGISQDGHVTMEVFRGSNENKANKK